MAPDRVKPAMIKPSALCATLLFLAILPFGLSGAAAAPYPAALCDRAAAGAAKASGVPIDILLAISRVETGRQKNGTLNPWPWTINADGKGAFYDSKTEAIAAATAHLTDGTGTFDIGCFQLNIRWHGGAFSTLEDMFDPDQNASYAAKFLTSLYQETGNWADAVAAYHSRTPDLAETYLNQVKAVLHDGGPAAPTEVPQTYPVRENTFPLLRPGAQGSFGSIVPYTAANGPLFGGNP